MLKKEREVKWTVETRESFYGIKKEFSKAPILASLVYQMPFLIFSFASPNTVTIVLLQKNNEG